jgi:hypothetical protein
VPNLALWPAPVLTSARLELLPSGCERLPSAPARLCEAVNDGVTVGIMPTGRITDDWQSLQRHCSPVLPSQRINPRRKRSHLFYEFFEEIFPADH